PWPSLDHTGVFARNVADAALMASIIATKDIVSAVAAPARPPAFAVVRSPVWHLAEDAQKSSLAGCAQTLREAGARADEVALPAAFADAHRVHRVILAYEGAAHFGALQREHSESMSTAFNDLIDEGAGIS